MRKQIISFFDSPKGPIVVIMLIIAIWAIGGFVMYYFLYRCSPTDAGTFGDMFGVVNALFSAFAVVGIFYTIRLQKAELRDTKLEISRQADNAARHAETSIKQNKNLVLQRFENTLFNLITIYNQIVTEFKDDTNRYKGKEAFPFYLDKVLSKYRIGNTGTYENYFPSDRSDFVDRYNLNATGEADATSYYYRHVTNILIFIKDATLSKKRRKFYLGMFLSLLSDSELKMLYFHISFDNEVNSREQSDNLQRYCKDENVFSRIKGWQNHTFLKFLDHLESN
jgi:hypothetical protein